MFYLFKKDHLFTFLLIALLCLYVGLKAINISCLVPFLTLKSFQLVVSVIGAALFLFFSTAFFDNNKMLPKKNYIPHAILLMQMILIHLFLPLCAIDLLALVVIVVICFILSILNIELNQMNAFFNIGILLALATIFNPSFIFYTLGVFVFILLETRYSFRYYLNVLIGLSLSLGLYTGLLFMFDSTHYWRETQWSIQNINSTDLSISLFPLGVMVLVGLIRTVRNRVKESGITNRAQNILLIFCLLSIVLSFVQINAHFYFIAVMSTYFASKFLLESKSKIWVEVIASVFICSIVYLLLKQEHLIGL